MTNYTESAVIPVTLTINPVNDAPAVAAPVADFAVDEDASASSLDLSTDLQPTRRRCPDLRPGSNSNPALVTTALDGAALTLSFAAEREWPGDDHDLGDRPGRAVRLG